MARVEESTLEITLELQGRSLTRAKSWEIDADYLTSTDGFKFDTYAEDLSTVRGLEMQPVTLSVGGNQQLVGRIERSTMGGSGTAISYEGRDYIADMVECAVDPNVMVPEGLDLAGAVTLAAGPVGIDTVVSDSDFALRDIRTGRSVSGGANKDFRVAKASDVKPGYGDGIYSYLNRIVARQGATIQPAGDRNTVALTVPNYGQSASYGIRRRLGETTHANNVVRGTATRDYSSFPTFTIYNGEQTKVSSTAVPTWANIGVGIASDAMALGVSAVGGANAAVASKLYRPTFRNPGFDGNKRYSTAEAAAGFSPSAADVILGACHIGRRKPTDGTGDPLKMYRLMAHRDADAKNQDQLDRAAVRATAERLKDTLIYNVEVQGHIDSASGLVWSVDTVVDVVDEVCDIGEPMWISRRTLKYSKSSGATTELVCWRPGAFIP